MLDRPESLDPEASFKQPDEKGIAVAITVTSQVGTNRNIVLQTFMDRDAPIAAFHAVVDKLTTTSNRQEAILQLEEEEATLDRVKRTLDQQIADFNLVEPRAEAAWQASGKKGTFKMNPNEIAAKENCKKNIEQFRSAIKKHEEQIAKYKAVIAKVD
jgi:hypothetical protein